MSDRLLPRRLKAILVTGLAVCFVSYAAFATSLLLAPHYFWTLAVSLFVGGGMHGFMGPLFYELISELAYPIDESTAAMIMTIWNNVAVICGLVLAPLVPAYVVTMVLVGCALTCLLVMIASRESYARSDAHESIEKMVVDYNQLNA